MNDADIVCDIIARLRNAVAANGGRFDDSVARSVERAVRSDWGGDRPFIARRSGEGRSERNAAILRDYQAGERLGLLERRYQLTRRRLLQIVSAARRQAG